MCRCCRRLTHAIVCSCSCFLKYATSPTSVCCCGKIANRSPSLITPHISCHTSHVTRKTSHVTRHTSHVTRHTSHVTRHTSHVTRHTSHTMLHRSAACLGVQGVLYGRGPDVFDQRCAQSHATADHVITIGVVSFKSRVTQVSPTIHGLLLGCASVPLRRRWRRRELAARAQHVAAAPGATARCRLGFVFVSEVFAMDVSRFSRRRRAAAL